MIHENQVKLNTHLSKMIFLQWSIPIKICYNPSLKLFFVGFGGLFIRLVKVMKCLLCFVGMERVNGDIAFSSH